MVLYIPGIFGFAPFLFYYLELERISLYAELAILAMVSVSLSTLANVRTRLGKAGLALIVALLISGGLISPENTSDSQTFATSPVKPTTYLSETDLVAYDVILTNFNERLIETDYFSFTYLRLRDNSCQIAEIGANQSIQFQPGAVVYIRSTELSIHGLSFFPASGVTEISNWTILDSNSEDYRNGVNVLYDFGPSYISEWYAASQISNVD